MIQGSVEWLQARAGRVTASRVADLLARTKTGYGASRASYMAELVVERLTGRPAERFTNAAMERGTALEPVARQTYAFVHDVDVEETGLVMHSAIADFGASPDGIIGADGLLEIKCPGAAAHMETLLSGAPPAKYVTQMQAQMACTGRAWCDFVSFHPDFPAEMQMWVQRVPRSDDFIAEMEAEVRTFLGELDAKLAALRSRYMEAAA